MNERTYGINEWQLTMVEMYARDTDDDVDHDLCAHIRELQAEVKAWQDGAENDQKIIIERTDLCIKLQAEMDRLKAVNDDLANCEKDYLKEIEELKAERIEG